MTSRSFDCTSLLGAGRGGDRTAQRTTEPAGRACFSAGEWRKSIVERHGDGACAMSFQDGQQPKLHAELDRADAECAAGYAAAEIRHSLCCPAHKRGQEPFAAVGRCTVMYGMYGKNGSGGIPSKYRTLSDIPYTGRVIFRAVRQREMTA